MTKRIYEHLYCCDGVVEIVYEIAFDEKVGFQTKQDFEGFHEDVYTQKYDKRPGVKYRKSNLKI